MLNQNRSVALRCLTTPAGVSVDGGTGVAEAWSSERSSTFITTVARRKSSIVGQRRPLVAVLDRALSLHHGS